MDDERAPDLDVVAERERLVEQRGPSLSAADWFFAHAVTMRAAHVRPTDRSAEQEGTAPEPDA